MNPEDLLYTREHEWVRIAGDTGTVGITDHAQDELGDVVYVELPKSGARFKAGQVFGTVESVKAVSELFIPVSGEVIEVNDHVVSAPETLNSDPYGAGWLIRVRLSETKEAAKLMSAKDYEQFTAAS